MSLNISFNWIIILMILTSLGSCVSTQENPDRTARSPDVLDNPTLAIDWGTFFMPVENIYSPEYTWHHVLELDVPCACETFTQATLANMFSIVNTANDALDKLHTKFRVESNTTVPHMLAKPLDILVKLQGALVSHYKTLDASVEFLHSEAQFVWGLLPYESCKKCGIIGGQELKDMTALRAMADLVFKTRLTSSAGSADTSVEFKDEATNKVKRSTSQFACLVTHKNGSLETRACSPKNSSHIDLMYGDGWDLSAFAGDVTLKTVAEFVPRTSSSPIDKQNSGLARRTESIIGSSASRPITSQSVEIIRPVIASSGGFKVDKIDSEFADYRSESIGSQVILTPELQPFAKTLNILSEITKLNSDRQTDYGYIPVTVCIAPIASHLRTTSDKCQVRYLKKDDNVSVCGPTPVSVDLNPASGASFKRRVSSTHLGDQSSAIISTTKQPPIRAADIFIRRKRWTFARSWFGLATAEDIDRVDAITRAMDESNEAFTANQKLFASRINLQDATIRNLTLASEKLNDVIVDMMKEMESKHGIVVEALNRMSGDLSVLSDQVAINSVIQQIHITQTYALTVLQSALDNIGRSIDYYRALKLMATTQTVNVELVSGRILANLTSPVVNHIPSKFMIVPRWEQMTIVGNKFVTVVSNDRKVKIILKIPLIRQTSRYHTWFIQHVPTHAHQVGMVDVILENEIMVYDETNSLWAHTTFETWSLCSASSGRTCSTQLTWIDSKRSKGCLLNMYMNPISPGTLKMCKYRKLNEDDFSSDWFSMSVSESQWIISVSEPVSASEECSGMGDLGFKRMVTYQGVNLITVSESCEIHIGPKIFRPHYIWGSTLRKTIKLPKVLNPTIMAAEMISVIDISSVITTSNATLSTISAAKMNMSKLYLAAAVNKFSYEDIIAANRLQTKLVIPDWKSSIAANLSGASTTIRDLQDKIDDLTHRGLSDYLPWWMSLFNVSFSSIMFVALLMFVLFKLCKTFSPTGRAAQAASVAFSTLPTSIRASRVIQNTSVVSSTLPPILTTSHTLHKISDVILHVNETVTGNLSSDHLARVQNSHYWITAHHMVGLIIMLTAMWVCHSLLTRHLANVVRQLSGRLGVYPRVQGAPHNIGEIPVIIHILITVATWGRSEHVMRFEVGIQLTTLPEPAHQWFIKDKSLVAHSITGKRTSRWCKKVCWQIEWKKLCIRSKKFINLDTCASMPRHILVDMQDIINQISDVIPLWWTSIEPETITTVSIGELGNNNVVYNYQRPQSEIESTSTPMLATAPSAPYSPFMISD